MNIFVSYRSTDRSLVNQLVTDLADMGHEVWYDQELQGGQMWWDNILDKLRWCDLVIFALTPQSLDSYPCQLEYTYANALKRALIPVQLAGNINYNLLPVLLQERQIISYINRDIDSYKRLAAAIRTLPATPPLPDPLPEAPPVPISPLAPVKTKIDSPTLTYEQQVALLHQLKSYLHHEDYGSDARHLLSRLSQHPTLFASVLRDIDAALAAPAPEPQSQAQPQAQTKSAVSSSTDVEDLFTDFEPSIPSGTAATPTAPPEPDIELKPGETIVRELSVNFLDVWSTGSLIGLASGVFTYGLTTAATAALRKARERKLIVTDQRLIFKPSGLQQDVEIVEIPLDEIIDLQKILKSLDPAIKLQAKSGDKIEFSIISGGGVGFGNREELITLVNRLKAKG
jgi:hypothetical protein